MTGSPNEKSYSAVILAAGSGTRMGAAHNKIFLTLNSQAVYTYSLDLFLADADCAQIILVGKVAEKEQFLAVLSDKVQFVVGGAERQDSVRNALAHVSTSQVMIHDGARPFVTLKELSALKTHQNAILAVPVKDTIKQSDDGKITHTVPRQNLWSAQTPQYFETAVIRTAHEAAFSARFLGTDDASLLETFSDIPVDIVMGSYDNIKLTTPEDLTVGQAILAKRGQL
ncbi:2-C-methyl-D-erythritol 4-phosphate cytidylyltransferase [Lactococcus insecticola]|uniref:2-C-methyl-D-erythritol 4-phosphate cytidylyltransferase n=1 Tax=Pseudolactococcus insecticola TaxID=2709158 RepID=A0A6A0B9X4_9LACT|nr:2-C-methyl-D-erythritol 4-phosphate cytidylyltransferase [Lactococcus insecticola]GFH40617.1 2-C-methyl-D-erythritol 4-phosphate cytidylyltransferase [Lactococcus insecticola]